MRFRHNGGDDGTHGITQLSCPSRHNPMHNDSRKKSHTMFEFPRNERARQLRPSLPLLALVRANSSEDVF